MFGDPNKNEKKFKVEELKNCIFNIENGKVLYVRISLEKMIIPQF